MKTAAVLAVVLLGLYSPAALEHKVFPLAIRLNNPCSIKHTQDKWQGEARLQKDKHFVRFLTPEAGIRAAMKTLLTYENLHQITTINTIIHRWAPPLENNTNAYVRDVSDRMGISANSFIDMSDPDMLIGMTKAIVMHENGHSPFGMPVNWYEEVVFHDAAMDALNGVEE